MDELQKFVDSLDAPENRDALIAVLYEILMDEPGYRAGAEREVAANILPIAIAFVRESFDKFKETR